ncbi:MAG: aldo/keto reductase, partial [Bacteroidaceae bacterium]|nr:aldo/keto reductase [Bacteroidaceae bacterium]
DRIRRLNHLATQRGESLSAMALSWILHHPGITSVLIGASSPEQLHQNLAAMKSPGFSEEEFLIINNILK